jgi:16S rRNA (adenine1518-N6/adenine1519-N6)-dimethyltransferase
MGPRRQTASYLMRRFREAGIRPDARRGQSFLVDQNLLHLLARSADLGPDDVVLEVGSGVGALTAILAAEAAAVVSVEVDWRLCQMAEEELVDFDNVTLLQQDALKNKNNLDSRVIQAVKQQLAAAAGRQFKLAANLPYSVATPIISNLLRTEITPVSMTVTIQKELADRLTAAPGTKDYGAVSVWAQSLCDIDLIRVMPPAVFWPRPKVFSAIIRMVPVPSKREQFPDLEFFHSFVRAIFRHRRKLLRGVVLSGYKGRLDKPAVDQLLANLGLNRDARAEQLDPAALFALSEAVRKLLSGEGETADER